MPQKTAIKSVRETKMQAPAIVPVAPVPAQPNAATRQASASIFTKIKNKVTHVTPEQMDAWQKSWLGMPETRKKYEHLEDAPQVVGEELIAMSNDIIDFIQKQEGGKSVVFKKIKEALANPMAFIKKKIAERATKIQPQAACPQPAEPVKKEIKTETRTKPIKAVKPKMEAKKITKK
ncbi:hypothetical protein JXA05_02830 [Candidatus Peregrinibacteria bacterium]|nr:hypothetical protein [Candidatus Peregrinibacteria bacterium]